MRHLICLAIIALLFSVGSKASACMPPPPMTPEATAAMELEAQKKLWNKSASVFVARSENLRLDVSTLGNRVDLVPLLQLKGPVLRETVTVAHTGMSSCGPLPSLNALNDQAGGLYVVYSDTANPTAASVTNTMHPHFLREPAILEAWQAAYDGASASR